MDTVTSFMGGLETRLSGDFLQMPPVQAAGFASPEIEDEATTKRGKSKRGKKGKVDDTSPPAQTEAKNDLLSEEREAGMRQYRSITNFIVLKKVVRAPNALGLLATCIRHLHITDTVWKLLQSCLLRKNDPRLSQPPWTSAPLRIVVQRHVQRTALANASALSLARQESATVCTPWQHTIACLERSLLLLTKSRRNCNKTVRCEQQVALNPFSCFMLAQECFCTAKIAPCWA